MTFTALTYMPLRVRGVEGWIRGVRNIRKRSTIEISGEEFGGLPDLMRIWMLTQTLSGRQARQARAPAGSALDATPHAVLQAWREAGRRYAVLPERTPPPRVFAGARVALHGAGDFVSSFTQQLQYAGAPPRSCPPPHQQPDQRRA